MALDDVVRSTITGPRIEEAMYRTLRWIDRCIAGEYVQYMFMIKWSSYIYQSESNLSLYITKQFPKLHPCPNNYPNCLSGQLKS